MIDLYYAPTPNGWKISIALEEMGLPYRVCAVDLSKGAQFDAAFTTVSPNQRIPAIVDHEPADGGPPLALFESGAILLYLAEKTKLLVPGGFRGRHAVQSWLMWQMAGFGPMLGQHGHFRLYAAERHAYATQRYEREARRLYGVLDSQLGRTGAYVAGSEFSIADIAIFPWAMTHKAQGLSLDDWPHAKRWFAQVRARDAVQRGVALLKAERTRMAGAPNVPQASR